MKNLFLIMVLFLVSKFGFSQVGINTATPDAVLDIKSSNQATPANNDGILIPKIDAFPVTNPTAAQNSMMVYLTTTSAGKPPGFYYWDNATTSWIGFSSGKGWDVLGNSGTNAATNFIGTKDDNDLAFRRNDASAGKISLFSTSIGVNSMPVNTAGNNTAFGNQTLVANTIGGSNTAMGSTSLFSNTTGNSNIALGYGSMNHNTTASNNTAVGNNSLFAQNFSNGGVNYSSNNTAIGESALFNNNPNSTTTGINNTAIGYSALSTNSTGSNNIGIGANSEVPNPNSNNQMSIGNVIYGATMSTTALGKIGIGVTVPTEKLEVAGKTKTTDLQVTNGSGIGKILTSDATGNATWQNPTIANAWSITGNAGTNPTTNFIGTTDDKPLVFKLNNQFSGSIDSILRNVYFGFVAGNDTGTGFYNIALGYESLNKNTTGSLNIGVGLGALRENLDGYWNTAIGANAMSYNISGNNNVAFGYGALFLNETGSNNTANGFFSLINNKSGSGNVGFGNRTLSENQAGSNGIAIGKDAMYYANSTLTPFENKNIAIGFESLKGSTTAANNTGNANTSIGYQSLLNNSKGSDNTVIGTNALQNNSNSNKNTAIGSNALFTQSYTNGGVGYDTSNTAIGYVSLYNNNSTSSTNGNYNTAIGTYALSNNTTGSSNVAVGASALGVTWTGVGNMTGSRNVALGTAAIKSLTSGNDNLAVGNLSLNYNTTGDSNVSIGSDALFYSRNQSNGLAIGTRAMQNYAISQPAGINNNVAVGYESMKGATCCPLWYENTAIGYQTLTAISSGNGNTASGYKVLAANTTGSFNTAIGNSALTVNTTGSGNVALGYQAAFNETGSNKLYIENSNSATPLIYGEFDNDLIRINGKTEGIYTQLTANGDGQSSIYGYRTRDSQNDGISYSRIGTNKATSGYNYWGDMYSFGVTGHCFNDYTRTGGVLGADVNGAYWSSLGYKNSASAIYGVYATAALATGAGRFSQPQSQFSIGGGFYGGLIGSWSKGNMIGNINSGTFFASYNSGDEYTHGKQIEIVSTGDSKTAAYTVTSTEVVVYKKGKANLVNGSARVNFDKNYINLLGDIPVVTASPMGQCNGIYIESIDKTGFTIKELNNGISNISISWISVGDRVDASEASLEILDKNFDDNINEVMFNENNLNESAKAIWSENNQVKFGTLPENLKEKVQK